MLAVLVAGWAVFAAARALRGEEDAGRWELLLCGAVTRSGATAVVLAALAGRVRRPVAGDDDLAV